MITDGICVGIIAALLVLLAGWLINLEGYPILALGVFVGNVLIGVGKHIFHFRKTQKED